MISRTGLFLLATAVLLAVSPCTARADDIVDTAVKAKSFDSLVTAVKAAGLVEALKSEGPFTVFAPNDAAFAKVPKATLEELLADKERLAKLLTHHVVPGKLKAEDVVKQKSLKTLAGTELTVDTSAGVKIGSAKVLKTDIDCRNGVIHVIDTVLIP
jgi:uncharacterized surface protein with fasciclin (FAS1) repeats